MHLLSLFAVSLNLSPSIALFSVPQISNGLFFPHGFIFLLLILAYYSSIKNGLSIDENFHHINGEVRYHYLINLGNFEKYDFFFKND